jgi:Cu(I)/Ag(I) efflux system membrane fusion protein
MRALLLFTLFLFILTPVAIAAESGPSAVEEHSHTHFCPMHPAETGMEGDNCPICGMHLIPMQEQSSNSNAEQPHADHSAHHNHVAEISPSLKFEQNAVSGEPVYICPMHPHIEGEESDNCPICGMSLVLKSDGKKSHNGHEDKPEGAFMIDPSYIQTLGVKTTTVSHQKLGHYIRSYGRIVSSTRLEHVIDVRTKGWIVDLAVDAVGDMVKKGDLLFTYYSPDLMNAQADFLISSRLKNAAQRLKLYGMDETSIAALKKRKKFFEETPFYAPADGRVSSLNTRAGAFINEGGSVLSLQDYSKLWVIAQVPVRDISFLEAGTKATVTISGTGRRYEALIDFIYPESDPKSRTVPVRLVLDNEDGDLRPDLYADVNFESTPKFRLTVPSEAVLYGKMGAYVIEDLGDGYFRPVMVEIGVSANGLTEIKSGLEHGQSIVQSGQFMLDAESNLKGGMAAMGHDHGGSDNDNMKDMSSEKSIQDKGASHVH